MKTILYKLLRTTRHHGKLHKSQTSSAPTSFCIIFGLHTLAVRTRRACNFPWKQFYVSYLGLRGIMEKLHKSQTSSAPTSFCIVFDTLASHTDFTPWQFVPGVRCNFSMTHLKSGFPLQSNCHIHDTQTRWFMRTKQVMSYDFRAFTGFVILFTH